MKEGKKRTDMIGRIGLGRLERVTKLREVRSNAQNWTKISHRSDAAFGLGKEDHFVKKFKNLSAGLMDGAKSCVFTRTDEPSHE